MHSSRSFLLKQTRFVGVWLAMLAALMLVDGIVQMPAAAQMLPVQPSTVHPGRRFRRTPSPRLRPCERRSIS
jgi:hypothetical protein